MISRYGVFLPLPIVAALLAFAYGLSIHHAWISAILTFALVMLGGWLSGPFGQVGGVVVSALIIFIAFKVPEHKRQAHEEARREREVTQLPNEEDL